MSIDLMRKATGPVMQLVLIVMIGPLAIAIGLIEAFVPGSGVRFANGALEWVRGLPPEFWLFAGSAYGIREIKRGYEKHVEVKAAETLVEAKKVRDQLIEEQGES
jgi:hypothetical protein